MWMDGRWWERTRKMILMNKKYWREKFSSKDMPCAFNMQTFVPSLRRKTFFAPCQSYEKFAWSSFSFPKNPNRVTTPTRATEINCYWKLFSPFFFLLFLASPCLGWNCFIDHKLRLAPWRCFCYNRERWNINIILAHTKCKTVWLRTVSGEYFMLLICEALSLGWICMLSRFSLKVSCW